MGEKEATKDEWEALASSHDSSIDVGIPPSRKMIELLNARWPLSTATSVFDNGCGPGTVISLLIDEFSDKISPSTKLRAADFSKAWIKYLNDFRQSEISKGKEIWKRVETGILDAQDLQGVPDGSFSHVTAGLIIFLVPDPRKALRETRRVLTSENGGGVFALSCWQRSDWMEMMQLIGEFRPEKAGLPFPSAWLSLEGVRGELEATGYRDIEVVPVETSMAYESHESFVDFCLEKLPNMRAGTADMRQDEIQQLRQKMIEKMKQTNAEASGRMKGTCIVAVARK